MLGVHCSCTCFQPYLPISQKNSLLCPSQSGFCLFGSCENQLLSVVHDVYANFDQHLTLKVRYNFLDISKDYSKDFRISGKTIKVSHPSITFNILPVTYTTCQKHLGLHLDEKLSFYDHIKANISKAS